MWFLPITNMSFFPHSHVTCQFPIVSQTPRRTAWRIFHRTTSFLPGCSFQWSASWRRVISDENWNFPYGKWDEHDVLQCDYPSNVWEKKKNDICVLHDGFMILPLVIERYLSWNSPVFIGKSSQTINEWATVANSQKKTGQGNTFLHDWSAYHAARAMPSQPVIGVCFGESKH